MSTICKSGTFGHFSIRHSARCGLQHPFRAPGWRVAQKNGLSATGFFALSKYQRWYDALIDRAKARAIPACYTEQHHIVPRSIGGTDLPINLVRLTYREHFIAHWLLTKFSVGANLRKMQRALLAMSLNRNGRRLVSGWQVEIAKRAVRDLELDPEAERLWYVRWNSSYEERLARFKRNKRRGPRRGNRMRQKAA